MLSLLYVTLSLVACRPLIYLFVLGYMNQCMYAGRRYIPRSILSERSGLMFYRFQRVSGRLVPFVGGAISIFILLLLLVTVVPTCRSTLHVLI